MELEQTYKEVTFETSSKPDFLSLIKKAFPAINWDKPYKEFLIRAIDPPTRASSGSAKLP
jgi:hypothetical protein